MIINFVQIEKGLYNARFNIVYNGDVVGRAELKGRLGSMEGKWIVSCLNHTIKMKFNGNFLNIGFSKKYRPYQVDINNSIVTEVYQTSMRVNSSKIPYHTMSLSNKYDLFTVSLGDEGFKSTVFENERRIMQIDKSAVVFNDLHNYEIIYADDRHICIGLVFCCYMYTLGCYEPGKKVISSVSKTFATTRNEFLISKYDPNFKKDIMNADFENRKLK